MMENGQILYATENGHYTLKFIGSIRYKMVRGLEAFIEKVLSKEKLEGVLVDLTQADYLDSTSLGLLAKLASLMMERYKHKVTLLSTNDNINYLLDSIGLTEIFIVVDDIDAPLTRLHEIPQLESSELENAKLMLDAHRHLMLLNSKNHNEFKDVVSLLEQEISNKKQ